jgi:tetratricopeptide (TPR) repeat protein
MNQADALHLRGMIASQAGQHEIAAALLAQAIKLSGPRPALCVNLADALARQGKLDQAVACYLQALRASPRESRIHFALGNTLHAAAQHEEAARSYLRAIEHDPRHAESWHNLGVTRGIQQRPADAAAAYEQAIRLRPGYAEAHQNLGVILHRMGQTARARAHYREALRWAPDSLEVRYNLALLAQEEDLLEDAVAGYSAVLARSPRHPEARLNLGNALLALGRPEEAIAHYRRLDSAEARWNLSLALLLLGRFDEGWEAYEWRLMRSGAARRGFDQPLWDGSALEGRRILLHAEQGLGDTIQFARYVPLVRRRGGFVVLECHPRLARLLSGAGDETVARGDPLPPFDLHAPLPGLPRIFGTSLDSIPAAAPYLEVDRREVDRWRDAIETRMAGDRRMRVGLAWAGNPRHPHDRRRSIPARELAALAGSGEAAFFSLQKDPPEKPPLELIELRDSGLVDAAAILLNLDLLISVDTSLAHLAGALARPVWTLLAFVPDWRWMLGREDSPWYPTMRLYRQSKRGSWTEPLERVRSDLARLARAPAPACGPPRRGG